MKLDVTMSRTGLSRITLVAAVAAALFVLVDRPVRSQAQSDSSQLRDRSRPDARSTAAHNASGSPDDIEAFTEPYREIEVAAPEMGTVDRVLVNEGDDVDEGTVLAALDAAVITASLEMARAGMQAQGSLNSANADLQRKQTELQKLSELFERNHASRQEVDRVTTEVRMAEARVQSVREELEIKRLEFRRIEAQLEQRQVRSPIRGVVAEIRRDTGEFVSPSDPVIARVVQLDPLLIVFSVPLSLRNTLQKNQDVALRLDSTTETVTGTVEFVSPVADDSNTSVRVRIRLPNPDGQWQSGERAVLVSGHHPSTDPTTTSTPIARRQP